MFLTLFVALLVVQGKPYYLGPAYLPLLAAGAVAAEKRLRGKARTWAIAGTLLGGTLFLPLSVPLLPQREMVRLRLYKVNKDFAERLGWNELVATVAQCYERLPADERASTCLFTANYGEASALNLFGGRYGLPRAISGHNNYALWGAGANGADIITMRSGAQGRTETSGFSRWASRNGIFARCLKR